MIRRLTLLVACTLMTTALAMQPDTRQALPHRHPITLPLAADTTPRWEDTLHAFALELQRAYQLDEAVATGVGWQQLDVVIMRHLLARKYGEQPTVLLPPVEHLNEKKRLLPDAAAARSRARQEE